MEKSADDLAMNCGEHYQLTDYRGSGAYGTVCSAIHLPSMRQVAIKKCTGVFRSRTMAKRSLREVRILRRACHPNIVRFLRLITPADLLNIEDIYLVFELLDTDLSQVIKSSQPLTIDHVQFFMYQLISAVEYLHMNGVVHRDIKPRNILVNADCTLKLADFGLARLLPLPSHPEHRSVCITDYVTTRWYRAPEVLGGWQTYSFAVDMWAIGCILVELINRAPLFPGRDSVSQLEKIVQVLGKPHASFISMCAKMAHRRFLTSLPPIRGRALEEIVPKASTVALDLIRALLALHPDHRSSACQALDHPFLAEYVASLDPLSCPYRASKNLDMQLTAEVFAYETTRYDLESLKTEMLMEIEADNQSFGSECSMDSTISDDEELHTVDSFFDETTLPGTYDKEMDGPPIVYQLGPANDESCQMSLVPPCLARIDHAVPHEPAPSAAPALLPTRDASLDASNDTFQVASLPIAVEGFHAGKDAAAWKVYGAEIPSEMEGQGEGENEEEGEVDGGEEAEAPAHQDAIDIALEDVERVEGIAIDGGRPHSAHSKHRDTKVRWADDPLVHAVPATPSSNEKADCTVCSFPSLFTSLLRSPKPPTIEAVPAKPRDPSPPSRQDSHFTANGASDVKRRHPSPSSRDSTHYPIEEGKTSMLDKSRKLFKWVKRNVSKKTSRSSATDPQSTSCVVS